MNAGDAPRQVDLREEVAQADREAAASAFPATVETTREAIRLALFDNSALVQAFARHRTRAEAECAARVAGLPQPHPRGFYSPPEEFYASEVEAFEKAHPFISHEKVRDDDGTGRAWGRVRYHHSHVDATFMGWVCGRYSLTALAEGGSNAA